MIPLNALELLEAMVKIPSVNPFRYFRQPDHDGYVSLGTESTMNIFIEDILREAGFVVTRQFLHHDENVSIDGTSLEIPARWNVLGVRYPQGTWNGKSLLFFGHTDTVDVKHGWESDPFSISRRMVDGRELWFGLGANDMKGGLAAILQAVHQAHAQEYAIKVAFLVDEEFYSFGAELLCQSEFMSDVVFAIAPEIGDTYGTESGGSGYHQQIGIGRTGRVEYDFHILGRACHGADAFLHPDAVNAVHEAVKLQAALIDDCASVKREFIRHGARALNSAYLSYQKGGAPMLSVPGTASFVLDRTFLPDESPDDELKRLQQLVLSLQQQGRVDPRATITVSPRPRPTSPCKPYVCNPDEPEVRRLIAAVQRHAAEYSFRIGRSVADENRVAVLKIPTITLGPTGAGSHTNHEWVDPLSVVKVTDLFKELITGS
jgi:acetylornithine deacetylase/succinyl-diaminopimelate desuccinylase-like protein